MLAGSCDVHAAAARPTSNGVTSRAHAICRPRNAFLVVLAAMTVLRVAFAPALPLSGDEAYHWAWSRQLAGAYWDHPGLTAWWISLAALVLPSDTEIMVRLPAVLSLSATAAVAFLFARDVTRRLDGTPAAAERAGLLAGVLVLFAPLHAVLADYMSTDPPFVLFATLAWYLFFRAADGGGWSAWLGAGAAFGLAACGKFLAFTLPPTAVAVLAVHRPWRSWLARPQPWLAFGVALLAFSPVLCWNATHDWATFRFNFVERHEETRPSLLYPFEFIGGQALALSPLVFGAALGSLRWAARTWRATGRGAPLLLVAAAAVPLGFFLASSCARSIGLHWTAAAWVPALVCSGVWMASVDFGRWTGSRRFARWTFGTAIALSATLPFVAMVPARWTDFDLAYFGRPDRIQLRAFHERFGWRDLGAHMARVHDEMRAADPGRDVFFINDQYGTAAIEAFYLPDQRHVYLWSPPRHHGESYRHWDRFAALRGQNALLAVKRIERLTGAIPSVRSHFARVDEPEELPIEVDGRVVRSFYLVRCWDFDGRTPY